MESSLFDKLMHKTSSLDSLIVKLKEEIKLDSNSIESRHQLAAVYIKLNDFSKAVNLYIEILELDPNDELAIVQKDFAMTILSQGRLDIYACTNTHIDPWQ